MFKFKAKKVFLILTEQIAKPCCGACAEIKNISPGPLGINPGQVRPYV